MDKSEHENVLIRPPCIRIEDNCKQITKQCALFLLSPIQKLLEDSRAPPPVKCPTLAHSHDTPTPKTAANTTSALKVLPANTDAPSEPSSRLVTQMVLATVKIQKMCPDGKLIEIYYDYNVLTMLLSVQHY